MFSIFLRHIEEVNISAVYRHRAIIKTIWCLIGSYDTIIRDGTSICYAGLPPEEVRAKVHQLKSKVENIKHL